MEKERLNKKRYRKNLKRKGKIKHRVLCHSNKMSCATHSRKVEKKKVIIKIKKSFWQKIKELWRKIINN